MDEDIWKVLTGRWKEQYENEEACLRFMSAMHGSSLHGSDAVAQAFDLTAYTKCCDLGG